MKYHILLTDKFTEQLQNILFYIQETISQESAMKQLSKIEKVIHVLENFPYMGNVPKHSVIKKLGYRNFVIDNYLIFYKVFDDTNSIVIYAICNSKQDYLKIL